MGIADDLKKIWKHLTFVKEVQETYNVRTDDPRFLANVNSKVLQENAQLKAEKARLAAQIAEHEAAKKAEEHELIVKKEVIRQQIALDQQKREKSYSFVSNVKNLEKLPVFFLKSNKTYFGAKLKGIQLQDNEDGRLLIYPLITQKTKNGWRTARLKLPVADFREWFKNQLGIVSQLHAGRADTNFEFNGKGELMLLDPNVYEDHDTKQMIKVVPMDEIEKLELQNRIEELKTVASHYAQKLKEQLRTSEDLQQTNNDNEIEAVTLKQQRDAFAARYAVVTEKMVEVMKASANAQAAFQDAVLNQVLTEKQASLQQDMIEKLQLELAQYQAGGADEIAQNKLLDTMQSFADFNEKLSRVTVTRRRAEAHATPQQPQQAPQPAPTQPQGGEQK